MPLTSSFGTAMHALQHAITIAQRRHSVITSNISNVDTPKYQAKDIDFQEALARAMDMGQSAPLARTDTRHIDPIGGFGTEAEIRNAETEWNGVNWVDLDKEIAKLTENNLIYRSGVEAMLRRLATLKEVIREGAK